MTRDPHDPTKLFPGQVFRARCGVCGGDGALHGVRCKTCQGKGFLRVKVTLAEPADRLLTMTRLLAVP